jgi:hypothetical protein
LLWPRFPVSHPGRRKWKPAERLVGRPVGRLTMGGSGRVSERVREEGFAPPDTRAATSESRTHPCLVHRPDVQAFVIEGESGTLQVSPPLSLSTAG